MREIELRDFDINVVRSEIGGGVFLEGLVYDGFGCYFDQIYVYDFGNEGERM